VTQLELKDLNKELEFEQHYKETPEEIHNRELADKDDFGDTPEEIEKNVQAVMAKYDRESNTRLYKGISRRVVRLLFIAFSLYSVFLLFFPGEIRMERASFVGALVFLVFINFPATKKGVKHVNAIPWYDVILAVLGAVAYFYFVFNCRAIIDRGIRLTDIEVVLGAIGILVTLEACRRSVGMPIVIVASIFIVYALTQKSLRMVV
jgi:TRAP-type uncharacterized transport system fused permease subunit